MSTADQAGTDAHPAPEAHPAAAAPTGSDAPSTRSAPAAQHHGTDRSHFRKDIEGMRAIAVVSVMLWHAGLAWIPGGFVGADVFFVISGFLMTTILLRDVDTLGRIRVGRFYVRRIRRLLRAVTAALAGTALITIFILPPTRWASIAKDTAASALYVVNWLFAKRSTDYLAQGEAPSPLQHFWSLSVEEQFYLLLLPVLLAATLWFVKSKRARRTAIVIPTAIAVVGGGRLDGLHWFGGRGFVKTGEAVAATRAGPYVVYHVLPAVLSS